MKSPAHSALLIMLMIVCFPVYLFWEVFWEKTLIVGTLRALNEHGPLRFEALLKKMGYSVPNDTDLDNVKLIPRLKYGWILGSLLNCRDDGILRAVYDEGHSECHHATFNITLAGQEFLKNRAHGIGR